MTRTKLIDVLEAYLKVNGPLSLSEYNSRKDTPVNSRTIKQAFGSWSAATRFIDARKRRAALLEPAKVEKKNEAAPI